MDRYPLDTTNSEFIAQKKGEGDVRRGRVKRLFKKTLLSLLLYPYAKASICFQVFVLCVLLALNKFIPETTYEVGAK